MLESVDEEKLEQVADTKIRCKQLGTHAQNMQTKLGPHWKVDT